MIFTDVLRGLIRRWYIVIPGIVLAVAVALASWFAIKPGYERAATQLLIPGEGLIPSTTSNPYLYLGGLGQAADILVLTVGAESVAGKITDQFEGTTVEVARNPTTSGPEIRITVTSRSDGDAAAALDMMLEGTTAELARLQDAQGVAERDRISTMTLTKDESSTLQQRTRMIAALGLGAGIVAFVLVLASVVDGLVRKARTSGRRGRVGRKGRSSSSESPAEDIDSSPDDVAAADDDESVEAEFPESIWDLSDGTPSLDGVDHPADESLPEEDTQPVASDVDDSASAKTSSRVRRGASPRPRPRPENSDHAAPVDS